MKYTEGWKYRFYEYETVQTKLRPDDAVELWYKERVIAWLAPDGLLTMTNGFAWNGANCFPDTKAILRGSAAHDCLLTMLGSGLLCDLSDTHRLKRIKRLIDETLRDCYREDLLTQANRAGKIRGAKKRFDAMFMPDRVFRAVQKWGTPTGMKTVEVLEAP